MMMIVSRTWQKIMFIFPGKTIALPLKKMVLNNKNNKEEGEN